MSLSWAAVCKAANGGKYDGTNANEENAHLIARFDRTLANIKAEIVKLAPLVEAEAKKNNPLLRVPPFSLRLRILDFAINPVTTPFLLKSSNGRQGSGLPLCQLARHPDARLRLEALIVTIEKTTIEIHSGPANEGVQEWLGEIDFTVLGGDTGYTTGFDAVKSLYFPYFSRYPHHALPATALNQDIKLMLRCKNLTTVRLTWVDEQLTNFVDLDEYEPKPIKQIRREYRLDDMLGLDKLKHLSLRLQLTGRVYHASGDVAPKTMGELRKFFEAEFGKRRKARRNVAVD